MKRFLALTFTLLPLTACGNRNSTNNTEHPTGVHPIEALIPRLCMSITFMGNNAAKHVLR